MPRYASDDAFAEGVVKGFAESGANAGAGRLSGGASAGDAFAYVGIVAVLLFENFFVALFDLADEGVDVVWAELVERDLAEVRDQVDQRWAPVVTSGHAERACTKFAPRVLRPAAEPPPADPMAPFGTPWDARALVGIPRSVRYGP